MPFPTFTAVPSGVRKPFAPLSYAYSITLHGAFFPFLFIVNAQTAHGVPKDVSGVDCSIDESQPKAVMWCVASGRVVTGSKPIKDRGVVSARGMARRWQTNPRRWSGPRILPARGVPKTLWSA